MKWILLLKSWIIKINQFRTEVRISIAYVCNIYCILCLKFMNEINCAFDNLINFYSSSPNIVDKISNFEIRFKMQYKSIKLQRSAMCIFVQIDQGNKSVVSWRWNRLCPQYFCAYAFTMLVLWKRRFGVM